MYIIYDKDSNEYGVLKKKSLKDIFRDTCKNLKKAMPSMTPDHVFYTKEKITVPSEKTLIQTLGVDADMGIPTVHFYDSNKKVYDTSMYTSKHAKERYKIIKEINNLKEFFKFKKDKSAN
jgi:hypothetical protein